MTFTDPDILVVGSLLVLVLAIGLDATVDDLFHILQRPRLLIRGVLSVNVIVPIAAGLLTALFPQPPAVKAGILLMAISAIPPTLPKDELEAGAPRAYAYGLYLALALLTVAVVPLAVRIAGHVYGVEARLPIETAALKVGLYVILPLAFGLWVRQQAPRLASRIARRIWKLSMLLLVIGEAPVLVTTWPIMLSLLGSGAVTLMALLTVVSLAAGHLLGGPHPGKRGALALASATRHPAIATTLAHAYIGDPQTLATILLYLIVSMLIAEPYKTWIRRQVRESE
jgi:BASS family bile acid:Na+ symporter